MAGSFLRKNTGRQRVKWSKYFDLTCFLNIWWDIVVILWFMTVNILQITPLIFPCLYITALTLQLFCPRKEKNKEGFREYYQSSILVQTHWCKCVHIEYMSVCESQSVGAGVCCHHKRNLFTHVCAHKEVPFVFHQALQTLHHHRETSLNGPCPHAPQHRQSV